MPANLRGATPSLIHPRINPLNVSNLPTKEPPPRNNKVSGLRKDQTWESDQRDETRETRPAKEAMLRLTIRFGGSRKRSGKLLGKIQLPRTMELCGSLTPRQEMFITTELPTPPSDVLAFELVFPAPTFPLHLICLPQAYHKHTHPSTAA
jgi:hypothetical protein